MKIKIISLIALSLVLLLVLVACGPAGENPVSQPPVTGDGELPPVAAVKAREALADELGIGIEKIEIISQEQAEWSDSCLGLGGAAESCLLVIVPGWRVELSAEGQTYIARTDELGDSIRFE